MAIDGGCWFEFTSRSAEEGTESALFLIETAKLRGEDPGHYPLRAARAAIDKPGTVALLSSVD